MTTRLTMPKRIISSIAGAATIALSLWGTPTLAGDMFRTSNTRNIGNNTEAAFKAIFKEGNYREGKRYLQQAESTEANEPLVYALQASFAYTDNDWNAVNGYASKTLQAAGRLNRSDPLRSKLYTGVGNFLQGAYTYKQQGAVGALTKLQQVFQNLDDAEKISPRDPEFNLIQGYMNLMLAANLPFSNPNQAIEQLAKYAGPRYLADRGIAIGYRDLKQYDKALEYVNRAVQQTPNNPEVHYLKAQIRVEQGKKQKNSSFFNQAKQEFQTALSSSEQLPKVLVGQIFYEQCQNQNRLDNKNRECNALKNQIKNKGGTWGPAELPRL